MSEPNPLEDFVREYRDDPVKFVKEVLGATPLPYQAEFLDALAGGERKMSVRSGHGTGKTLVQSFKYPASLQREHKIKNLAAILKMCSQSFCFIHINHGLTYSIMLLSNALPKKKRVKI